MKRDPKKGKIISRGSVIKLNPVRQQDIIDLMAVQNNQRAEDSDPGERQRNRISDAGRQLLREQPGLRKGRE